MIDVNCFIGAYAFRELPHPDAAVLVRVLAREGLAGAWVGHLPTAFQRDVTAGNEALFEALYPHRETLEPVPAIRPDWPRWEAALADAHARGARAIRAYPMQWGMGAHDARLAQLAGACGEIGLPLVLTTRFEDVRQRSALDVASDLSGAHERGARAHRGIALGAHAGRTRAALVGHLVDLGSARGRSRAFIAHHRRRSFSLWKCVAASTDPVADRESRAAAARNEPAWARHGAVGVAFPERFYRLIAA
jgi:hypothetical protein